MSKVSWEGRFDYDLFLTRVVEKGLVADDQALALFDESLPNIRQCIANLESFQLFWSNTTDGRISTAIVRFILRSKRGHVNQPFQQNYLPLDGSVYEVDVLVQCRDDGRVEPMFMEYDPKTDTLRSYLEASIRIKRKPGCEWGRTLEDGWRVFQFVVCKGPQSQPTKAAHTVHRFICLGYDSRHQQEEESQQQQGSSHCCYPPLAQYNEMEEIPNPF